MSKTSKQPKAILLPRALHKASDIFPLIVWLWIERSSTEHIAEYLELSTRTVAGYLRRLRSRIVESAPTYTGQLTGVVHIDVWRYKPRLDLAPPRSSYSPKRPLLLGMLSGDGQLRLFVIPRKTCAEIHPLVKRHIERGTKIITNYSNVYTGLRKDGFPELIQKKPNRLMYYWQPEEQPNLYYVWNRISWEMKAARGVRNVNFIQRVREVELRWSYQALPKVRLYRHVNTLMGKNWLKVEF